MRVNIRAEDKRYDPRKAPYPYVAHRKLPVDDGEFLAAFRSMGARNTAEYYGTRVETVRRRARSIEGSDEGAA